jgi:FKBP-type peptidyl-prolyl cis-trans isomerase
VPTNQQRREAERRRLQRQLEERRAREAARKRQTLIVSIVGTVLLIAAIIIVVVITTSGSGKKHNAAAQNTTSPSTSPAPTTSAAAQCGSGGNSFKERAARGASVSFHGVTVKGATDLGGKPSVTSHATAAPPKLLVKDLVVGKGKPASDSSCVTVQYDGLLYKNGKEFDSSWSRGKTAEFSLAQVVPGFTQGIGGTKSVAPMRVGGRRLIIMPASLGYGSQANASIPANSPLVFVVDLKSIR